MRAVGDGDHARGGVPLHIVALKAPRRKLDNIDMPLCCKLARALVVRQIIALERNR